MKTLKLISSIFLAISCAGGKQAMVPSQKLANIEKAGTLRCGVSTGLKGFSYQEKGSWKGFDVEICQAVSLAIFGDARKVEYVPLNSQERFAALKAGKVDVLSRNTSNNLTRDTELGLEFGPTVFYDGQTFLSNKNFDYQHSYDLKGKMVCTQGSTSNESNIRHFSEDGKLEYQIRTYSGPKDLAEALENRKCDALTADKSALLAIRTMLKHPNQYYVSDENISKEALAPAVVEGEQQLLELVRWTVYALINAEELGITSQNVDEMKAKGNFEVKRLLGADGENRPGPWANNEWAYNIIKQLGNYGEIFERNVGADGPLEAKRGLNSLWKEGGLLYSPSML